MSVSFFLFTFTASRQYTNSGYFLVEKIYNANIAQKSQNRAFYFTKKPNVEKQILDEKHGESKEKRDEVRKLDIASNKFISSKYCANYPCVFNADSDFMGKYAKYTKYKVHAEPLTLPAGEATASSRGHSITQKLFICPYLWYLLLVYARI